LIILIILILVVLIVAGIFALQALVGGGKQSTYSGTIEATEIHLGAEASGRVDTVEVKEGDPVAVGQVLAVVHGDRVRSPIDGTVLERAIEPGEFAALGSTIVTVSDLQALKLTVYVPEDRYGQLMLGQRCDVTADSFPGQVFSGTISHIADQAEFTPRNVQTVESRKTTVFAIRFDLDPTEGRLKPGMPADVHCQFNP
jgi:HlyD family secretion protein